jgi:putative drug exporter of the RND superfamily
MILVPALMSILGPHARYLPRWLDRVIPDLQLEGPIEEPEPDPAPVSD